MTTRQISFAIQGMSSAKCAVTLERALAALDGVIAARVNYATERATVVFDPARVRADAFVRAVRAVHFDTPLERVTWRWTEWGRMKMLPADAIVSATFDGSNVRVELLAGATTEPVLPMRFLSITALVLRSFVSRVRELSMPAQKRLFVLSALAGILGFFALFALYIGIVSLAARSFAHAFELLAEDKWLVAAIATGFGTQVGLFAFLRLSLNIAARGATALAGAGTGTSTLSMIACCAHHITDVAPIVGLAGFTSAASFLTEYKVPFMLVGLAMNVVGIIVTLRIIQRSRMHLRAMATETAPACR